MTTRNKNDDTSRYLTPMELALRYGVSYTTVYHWSRMKGFPDDARLREHGRVYWDARAVDYWLHERPSFPRQRPVTWRDTVAAFVRDWEEQQEAA